MTRARAKDLHDKVNSLLSSFDFDSTLDGMLLHTDTLCILRYEPPKPREDGASSSSMQEREEEEVPSGTTASIKRYYRLEPEPALPPRYRSTSAGNTESYTVQDRNLAGTTA